MWIGSLVACVQSVFIAEDQFVTVDWHPAVMVTVERRRHHSHGTIDAGVTVLMLDTRATGPNGLHEPHAVFGEVADTSDDLLEFLSQ